MSSNVRLEISIQRITKRSSVQQRESGKSQHMMFSGIMFYRRVSSYARLARCKLSV